MISFLPKKGTRVRNLRLNEPLSNILATAIRQIHPGKKKLQQKQNKKDACVTILLRKKIKNKCSLVDGIYYIFGIRLSNMLNLMAFFRQ